MLRVDFFLYIESWTLNRVGASSTAGTGSSQIGESVIVALDVDDFWLRY
jgi:hypothetical protein